ncbi:hypothetical protein Hanom_Chr14g01251741 [Helianthus anomalus]
MEVVLAGYLNPDTSPKSVSGKLTRTCHLFMGCHKTTYLTQKFFILHFLHINTLNIKTYNHTMYIKL